jgi:CRP-like cAMP-binding protein
MKTGDESGLAWVKSKFLAGLSDAAMRQLLDTSQIRHIAPKQDVIVRGGEPDYLFLVKTGQARSYIVTEDGAEIILLWAAPGEVLGLVSLLPTPPAYMVNTTTVTACDCLVWNRHTIRKLAAEHPEIMENGFRVAVYHLRAYMKRHVNLVTKSAESRLANQLIQLATSSSGEVRDSGIRIDITNEQLSSLSDTGYFTTSRILSKWEQDGILSKERGSLTLLDPESLMAPEMGGRNQTNAPTVEKS